MKVETKTVTGEMISGVDCTISNDYGTISTKSGATATVRRSNKDMDIICKHPSNPDATARAISRANAGLAGNIIFGGGIGAIIDHNKGTAYTYPTWVQLVFGKTMVFDRTLEKDGHPHQVRNQAQLKARRRLGSNTSLCMKKAAIGRFFSIH